MRTYVFTLLLIILLILNHLLLFAKGQNVSSIDIKELDGIKVTQSKFYSGNDVYDYIDGAADLYFEYGFQSVSVLNVNYKGIDFIIEYHKHDTPVNAFGLMSVYSYECDSVADNINFACSCSNPYFLSFVSGIYFIRIINSNGSSQAMQSAIVIGNFIKSKLQVDDCKYPDFFLLNKFINNLRNLKYVCGPLGIQNILPGWERYLIGIKSYQIYSIEVSENDFNAIISIIEFGSDTDFIKFNELNRESSEVDYNDWIKEIDENLISHKSDKNLLIIKNIQHGKCILIVTQSSPKKIIDFVRSLKF